MADRPGMKRVAILQSCYIPWKGYFDLINSVDEFILYDDCQYTRQDWRNRNRVKTANGTRWLTIPVQVEGLYSQRLNETVIADPTWGPRHWDILRQAYRKAACFERYAEGIEETYAACTSERLLSKINRRFLETVCGLLGIETSLTWSTDYGVSGERLERTERVVSLCKQAGASVYVTGPRARGYIDEALFEAAAIELRYVDYEGYPEYPQLHPPFEHRVTILDLLFNAGPDAHSLMKSFRPQVLSRG